MTRVTWDGICAALMAREPARIDDPVASRAAVAMILRDGGAGIEVLFIRRAEHPEDPWSGHMAFPGGRQEAGDPDLRATAVRETAEEIGLALDGHAECLGALDEVRAMARMRPMNLAITPFVFRLTSPAEAVAGHEVRSVHWLPLDELLSPALRSTLVYDHQGSTRQFPCLRVEDLVIWGLTYRMFMSLQERFTPLPPPGGLGAGGEGAL